MAWAEVGLLAQAELAVAALGRVERNHMVAGLQPSHVLAHLHHDARALVAQDGGEQAFGVGTRQRVVVGVADAGGLHFDQHLVVFRGPCRSTVSMVSGAPALPGDGGTGFGWAWSRYFPGSKVRRPADSQRRFQRVDEHRWARRSRSGAVISGKQVGLVTLISVRQVADHVQPHQQQATCREGGAQGCCAMSPVAPRSSG